jgi:hypothetical protein
MRRCLLALLAVLPALAAAAASAQTKWHTLALGRVIVDAPVAWVATRDADGGFTIVEPERARWTLRIDSAQERAPAADGTLRVDRLAEALRAELLDSRGGTVEVGDLDIAEKLIVHDYVAVGPGGTLTVRGWHRIALGDTAIVIAHFIHEAPTDLAGGRDVRAARAMAHRLAVGAELNPLAVPYRAR